MPDFDLLRVIKAVHLLQRESSLLSDGKGAGRTEKGWCSSRLHVPWWLSGSPLQLAGKRVLRNCYAEMLRSFWLQEICRVSVRGTMQTQMEMSAAPLTPSQKSFSQVRALLCIRPSHKAQINVDSSALWTACTRAGFLLAPITLQDIQPPPCSQQGKLSPWCERSPTKPCSKAVVFYEKTSSTSKIRTSVNETPHL